MISHRKRDVTTLFTLLGLRGKRENPIRDENRDIARLFFDTFSKRIGTAEQALQSASTEIQGLRASFEHAQLSDLVLLERLQGMEKLVKESLGSIRESLEQVLAQSERLPEANAEPSINRLGTEEVARVYVRPAKVVSPTGEIGSLPSITTPTELQVLTLLANEGAKSAPEIGKTVGRSREHTARLMKKLFDEGYIRRDQSRIPFRYSLVDKVKVSFERSEVKNEERESVSIPQA